MKHGSSTILTDIGFQTNISIIIGDNLTPLNYPIFHRALHLKQIGSLSIVSVFDGLVFITACRSNNSVSVNKLGELDEASAGTGKSQM